MSLLLMRFTEKECIKMLSLSAIRQLSCLVLDDDRIMIALRDLAVMHQTDLSAWTYVLTDEEIIFTHRRVGEARWPHCKVLRAARPQVPLVDKPDIRVQNEGSLVLFEPLNAKAAAFMNDALADALVFNNAVVIEDRHASEIASMLQRKGFVLGGNNDGNR